MTEFNPENSELIEAQKRAAKQHTAIHEAGHAALVAAGYSDEEARAGAGDDFEHASHLIEHWGLVGTLEDWLHAIQRSNSTRLVAQGADLVVIVDDPFVLPLQDRMGLGRQLLS